MMKKMKENGLTEGEAVSDIVRGANERGAEQVGKKKDTQTV